MLNMGIYRSTGILVFTICFTIGEDIQNDWPTYERPGNTTQLCYLCAPGFHLVNHCEYSNSTKPAYSTCKKCKEGYFTRSWNKDESCKKKIKCKSTDNKLDQEKDHCCCPVGMIEEHGHCVQGISKHRAHHVKCQRHQTTCPACPEIQENMETKLEYWHLAVAFMAGMIVTSILAGIVTCCCFRSAKCNVNLQKCTGPSIKTNEENDIAIPINDSTQGSPVFVVKSLQKRVSDSGVSISIMGSTSSINSRDDQLMFKQNLRERIFSSLIENDDFTPLSGEDARLDDACRIMERLVVRDPTDFNRQVLGLSIEDCLRIENHGKDVSSQIRHGFLTWKQINGSNATVDCLMNLLRQGGRKDVADAIENQLDTSSMYETLFMQAELDIAISLCEKHLDIEDALPLFRMQMELGEMESFPEKRSDCVRDGLSKWKAKQGKYATAELLLTCLKEAGLMDLHDKICLKLKLDSSHSNEEDMPSHAGDEPVVLVDETHPKSHNYDVGALPPTTA